MHSIDIYMALSYLLIITLIAYSLIRGGELITQTEYVLSVSKIYGSMHQVVDIRYFGFALIMPSTVMFVSLFFINRAKYILLFIGSTILIGVHLFYASFRAEEGLLDSTVTFSILYASIHLIVSIVCISAIMQLNPNKIILHEQDEDNGTKK